MSLFLFGVIFSAIVEFLKTAFKLSGWGVRIVAAIVAIPWALLGNAFWFHFQGWQVVVLMLGIWSIPSGFYDLLVNVFIPFIGWLLLQLGGQSTESLRDYLKRARGIETE